MKSIFIVILSLFVFFGQADALCQKGAFTADKSDALILTYPFPDPDYQDEETCDDEIKPSFIPINAAKKTDDEIILEKSPHLEARLSGHIFGQESAVKETTDAIIRFAAGVNDPNSPIASLLYSGPSGVGKTELAKQLCLELYGTLTRLIRINMSEFSEPHSLSRLIGSPPGYVGYGEGGQLTNLLSKNPYSVVLLDEIEKAHPKVLKLFLQAFDEGFITSSTGKIVDCRKSIFILTSNLAASEIADLFSRGFTREEIVEILKPAYMSELSPELFNRIDLIIFSPLHPNVLESLINKMLKHLADRVFVSKKVSLKFDQSIVDYFMDYCLDPKLGARPLKRLIDKELATVIAKAIIQGKCTKGDTLKCYYQSGSVFVEKL